MSFVRRRVAEVYILLFQEEDMSNIFKTVDSIAVKAVERLMVGILEEHGLVLIAPNIKNFRIQSLLPVPPVKSLSLPYQVNEHPSQRS